MRRDGHKGQRLAIRTMEQSEGDDDDDEKKNRYQKRNREGGKENMGCQSRELRPTDEDYMPTGVEAGEEEKEGAHLVEYLKRVMGRRRE